MWRPSARIEFLDGDRSPGGLMPAELFVGREDEQSAVRALVDRACDGHGGFLIIEGPAGIGKSALLRHIQEAGTPANFLSVGCHVQVGQLAATAASLEVHTTHETRRWLLAVHGQNHTPPQTRTDLLLGH
ncbi:ATP-binding protein [Micromonospora profundi]|uniref:ATP-binding protein n=1 Tax=Micromonospora profundi TaxID=1420889 RepID=UPI003653F655